MSEPGFEKKRESSGKRLKILHIAGWYPSKRNPVAGIFVREHVKATALYNDVVVFCSEGISTDARSLYEIEDNIENGIRTLRACYRKSPIPKTTYLILLVGMFRAFRKLIREGFRPDVIHAHVYSAGFPAVLLGKLYKLPVIITEHITEFQFGLIGSKRLIAKFSFEWANLVCPVSEGLKRAIESHGIHARFQVVPNCVDTSLFYPARDKSHAQKGNKKRLLFVGNLIPRKGIPYLLKALTRLREKRDDFVLDIVGDGPNRAEYEELGRKLGLEEIVFFHGRLKTKQEVAELMRKCVFFVLPSLAENFGVVLIEAMACGKPVVATATVGASEIVSDKVGKLVPPGDSEALAEAIDYMLDHYSDYDWGEICQYVRSHFSYEVVGKKLHSIYRELTAR